ncbi:P-loop containing nucleoside triphosphate hydrolase protein [Haematococcus lacustris]
MSSAHPCYTFTPKHQGEVKLHVMSGVTLVPWLRLLWCYARVIHWRLYWHRVLFLSFMACLNTLLALPDWWRFSRSVAGQALHAQPLIILGHPRTGTTHLHNLLALDPAFAHATTFQAGFPSAFITLEEVGARPLLQPLLSKTRPMDAMKLDWDLPAEDEIAVNLLTGGVSYYLPLVVPCEEAALRPLLSLRGLTPAAGLTAWQDALIWFLKKVTFRDCYTRSKLLLRQGQQQQRVVVPDGEHTAAPGAAVSRAAPTKGSWSHQGGGNTTSSSSSSSWREPRPLLIKSPVHTARLAWWRSAFPQARYLYIHRHPVQVMQSSFHMADTYFWYCYLQQPSNEELTDHLVRQFVTMHQEYVAERMNLAPGSLVELSFAELEKEPLQVLRRVYAAFGWSERFEALLPRFQTYCASLADFKKNQLGRLDPALEQRIREECHEAFQEWGYA